MNILKTGYYQADTANGVTFLGAHSRPNNQENRVTPEIFYSSLKDLADDEIVVSFLKGEILEKIEQEYGIR